MRTNPISQDPLIGTRIDGRYLIRGVLGRGGMGVVYDGLHEQLERPVAIKVLAAGTAGDPLAVQRFLREARTASTLTHGNIVDVSDLGELADGRPYLVMPKVSGMTLSTLLEKKGQQPPERVVELLRGAASALDLIHAKGLVHRDVKPENLMHVVREDGSETTLLLDFGIVALVATQTPRLTASGSVFGTPAYLAPETLQRDADRSADVYSLATVAFELLAGQVPFDAPTPLRLVQMKSQRDAPSLAATCGKSFAAAVEAAIAKGLAREPAQRYQSAGAFVQALENAVRSPELDPNVSAVHVRSPLAPANALTGAQTPSEPPVAKRAPLLHRRWLVAGAVPALVAAAFVLWSSAREERPTVVVNHGAAAERAPLVVTEEPRAPVAEPVDAEPAEEPAEPPQVPSEPVEQSARPKAPRTPKARASAKEPPLTMPAGPTASELNKRATQELLQGRLARADQLYAEATRVEPNSEAAWRGLGLTRERLGRKDEALRAFRRALMLEPKGPQAESLRARIARLERTR